MTDFTKDLTPQNCFMLRERHDYGAYPAAYYYLAWINERTKKQFGDCITAGLQTSIGEYHNGKERAIMHSAKQWNNIISHIVSCILSDASYLQKLNQESKRVEKEFRQFSDEIVALFENSKITDQKVIELHKKWIYFYGEYSFWNCLVWCCAADDLYTAVSTVLTKEYNLTAQDLQLLTTPITPSFVFVEECEMLKIAAAKKVSKSEISQMISEHLQKWRWIPWDYVGPKIWTETDVLSRINAVKNPDQILDEKILFIKNLEKKQKQLISSLCISAEHKRLIEDVQTLALMQDEKKAVLTYAQFVLHNYIFTYIGKKIDLLPVHCCKFSEKELWDAMLTGDVSHIKKTLSDRLVAIVSISHAGGIDLMYGEAAKKLYENFSVSAGNISSVSGVCASLGCVRGTAKILASSRDISKIKKGDILITPATTPDFIIAMKLAAAIVTCEGGLTSHAAIISRELGIPCIVGARMAMQVFKDGDLVEVDATKSVVRLIKS